MLVFNLKIWFFSNWEAYFLNFKKRKESWNMYVSYGHSPTKLRRGQTEFFITWLAFCCDAQKTILMFQRLERMREALTRVSAECWLERLKALIWAPTTVSERKISWWITGQNTAMFLVSQEHVTNSSGKGYGNSCHYWGSQCSNQ